MVGVVETGGRPTHDSKLKGFHVDLKSVHLFLLALDQSSCDDIQGPVSEPRGKGSRISRNCVVFIQEYFHFWMRTYSIFPPI